MMRVLTQPPAVSALPAEYYLPLLVLDRYLFFLSRRPISQSNLHYARRCISGLRELGLSLESVTQPPVPRVVQMLRTMQPQNLETTSRRLQLMLNPLTQTELQSDVLALDQPLHGGIWAESKRILMLCGPAIGIGDEIITFRLPSLIKTMNPETELVLYSGYRGLWQAGDGVDEVRTYDGYLSLVHALRGGLDEGAFDLVILVDFESPDLYQAVCNENILPRYVELSLGARRCSVVDNTRRQLYQFEVPPFYYGNYYDSVAYLLKRIGLSPQAPGTSEMGPRNTPTVQEALRIYVSPFTSKYDPSRRYWSRLLQSLAPSSPANALHFVLDPGPNAGTWRFAQEVVQAAAANSGAMATFEVARDGNRRSLPLPAVFTELKRADTVICADSFTAHAGPAHGAVTLVVASRGLEDWRVPAPQSFYFSAEAPLPDVAAGMQQILGHLGAESVTAHRRPAVTASERQFLEVTNALWQSLHLDGETSREALLHCYQEFTCRAKQVTERLPLWPARTKGLLDDFPYEERLHPLDDVAVEYWDDVRNYIENSVRRWRNTNLYKYLSMLESTIEQA